MGMPFTPIWSLHIAHLCWNVTAYPIIMIYVKCPPQAHVQLPAVGLLENGWTWLQEWVSLFITWLRGNNKVQRWGLQRGRRPLRYVTEGYVLASVPSCFCSSVYYEVRRTCPYWVSNMDKSNRTTIYRLSMPPLALPGHTFHEVSASSIWFHYPDTLPSYRHENKG